MQGINAQIIDIPGYAALPIDMCAVLSNIITVMTHANHRAGRYRSLTTDVGQKWRNTALRQVGTNRRSEIATMLRENRGSRPSPLSLLTTVYGEEIAFLASPLAYVRDVGRNTQDYLKRSGAWKELYVASPALGYARGYMKFTLPVPPLGPYSIGGSGLFRLQLDSYDSDAEALSDAAPETTAFVAAIADLCMCLDRPFFSSDLVPESSKAAKRDAREPIWGEMEAVLGQMDRLTSVGLLYEVQADALMLRWHQQEFDFAHSLALEQFPSYRPVLEMYKAMRDELLARLPIHPVLEAVARLLANVTINTQYGSKPAVVIHHADAAARADLAPFGVTEKMTATGNAAMAVQMLGAALTEAGRLSEVASSGGAWAEDWLQALAPGMNAEARKRLLLAPSSGGGVSFADAIHRLIRAREFADQWSNIAPMLGWSSTIGATPAVTLEASSCDFVLTDGDGYSDDPLTVLAGLRPSYPIGNPRASRIAVRYEADFGIGPVMGFDVGSDAVLNGHVATEWSIVTAPGHFASLDGRELMSRFFMPPGMLMGEEGGEPRLGHDTDPENLAVRRFYEEKSSGGYVRQYAVIPDVASSQVAAGTIQMVTSWDGFALAEDRAGAQSGLLRMYGPAVDKKVEVFMYRADWNMRFPVRLARANCYWIFDELGAYLSTGTFEGHVAFTADNDVSRYSTTSVQALIDAMPIKLLEGRSAAISEATPPVDPSVVT